MQFVKSPFHRWIVATESLSLHPNGLGQIYVGLTFGHGYTLALDYTMLYSPNCTTAFTSQKTGQQFAMVADDRMFKTSFDRRELE